MIQHEERNIGFRKEPEILLGFNIISCLTSMGVKTGGIPFPASYMSLLGTEALGCKPPTARRLLDAWLLSVSPSPCFTGLLRKYKLDLR